MHLTLKIKDSYNHQSYEPYPNTIVINNPPIYPPKFIDPTTVPEICFPISTKTAKTTGNAKSFVNTQNANKIPTVILSTTKPDNKNRMREIINPTNGTIRLPHINFFLIAY